MDYNLLIQEVIYDKTRCPTQEEKSIIKSKWKRWMTTKGHPDKGGNEEVFKKIFSMMENLGIIKIIQVAHDPDPEVPEEKYSFSECWDDLRAENGLFYK